MMNRIFQIVKGKRPKNNQAGQAAIDYILVLVVTIILLLMLRGFYKPFRQWLDNYFTNYLACLIETGELPFSQDGECETESGNPDELKTAMQKAQKSVTEVAEANRPRPVENRTSGSSGSNNSQNGRNNSRSSSSNSGSQSARATNDAANERDQNSGGQSQSGRSRRVSRASRVSNAYSSGDLFGRKNGFGEDKKIASTKETKDNAGDFGADLSSRNLNGRKRKIEMNRSFFAQEEQQEQKDKAPARMQKKSANGDSEQRPTRMKASTPKPKVQDEGKEQQWSLGELLRIMIILAIIIAIFFLVGGQALQLSKSWEK